MAGILGKKLGMTQLFTEEGERVPVTVIQAGPCAVTAVREPERDGYRAVQLAFGETKEARLDQAAARPPEARGRARRCATWPSSGSSDDDERELRSATTLGVADLFEKGQRVKVSGRSKGKGFQGTIRRHGFSPRPGQPRLPQRARARARSARARRPRASSRARGCPARWATGG